MHRSTRRIWIILIAVAILDLAWRLIVGFSLHSLLPFESAVFAATSLLLVFLNVRFPLPARRLRLAELGLAGIFLLSSLRALLWFVGGDVASANLVVLSIFIASGLTLLVIRQMTLIRPRAVAFPEAEVVGEPSTTPGLIERWGHEIAVVVLAVLVAGTTAIMCYQMWDHTPDRTFISLRYADHVQGGEGLVWNRGEEPVVERFESLVWVLLLAVVPLDASAFLQWTKLLSTGAFGGMILLLSFWLYRVTRRRAEPPIARLGSTVSVALFLLTPGVPLAIISASETNLLLFSLTLLLMTAESFCESSTRSHAIALGAASVLAILTHPVLILACGISLAITIQIGRDKRTLLQYAILPAGIAFIAWTLWRTIRTGSIIPYALSRLDLMTLVSESGISAIGDALLSAWPLWIFAFSGMAVLRRRSRSHRVLFAGLALVLVLAAIDPERFLLLILIPLTVLTGVGVSSNASRSFRDHSLVALVGFAIIAFAWHSGRYTSIRMQCADETHTQRHVFEALGRSLAEIDSSGEHSIAITPVGAVGYFSRWHVTDLAASTRLATKSAVVALRSRTQTVFDPATTTDAEAYSLIQRSPFRPAAILDIDAASSLWIFTSETPILRALGPQLQRRSGAFMHLPTEKRTNGVRR